MIGRREFLSALLCAVMMASALLAAAAGALAAEQPLRGVALAIGQSRYQSLAQLPNPAGDAESVGEALTALGFETTVLHDLNARKLRRALDNFAEDAAEADVAVVYYSGHGVEAGGDNWLIPTDADGAKLEEAEMAGLSALIRELSNDVPLTIVFLDACRTNPFPPGTTLRLGDGSAAPVSNAGLGGTRGASEAGTAPATANLGTVVGFAAEPGQVALDGPSGGNSPYASALVRHLSAMDGAEFGTVMRMVTEEVYLKTQGAQRPWVNETLTRLVYVGTAPAAPGDEGRILSERRQLLVTMTALSAPQREQVETAARSAGVPMDALYGLLRALGRDVPADPEALGKVLDAEAARIKDLLTAQTSLASEDQELQRLNRLAAEALQDGALEAHLAFREQAKARYLAISASLDASEAQLKARRLEGGEVMANAAAAHELRADYREAARNYAEAFAQVEKWDAVKAWEYKRREADAWLSQGDERGDTRAIEAALAAFGQALALAPRETQPVNWAMTQNNFGNALLVKGRAEIGTASLEQAVAAYRLALEVRSRAAYPKLWARTQNNLAIVFLELSERSGDPALVNDAVSAYRAALTETPRQDEPLLWATMMSNLGNALQRQGGVAVEEAIAVHRAALEERPRHKVPTAWAASQENLGNALDVLGKARGDAGLIREGIAAYKLALEEVKRETLPLVWAGLHYNLGNAHGSLADLEDRDGNLRRSVAAYRETLKEETFERTPQAWAKTQYMLGERLWLLGEENSDNAIRKDGVEALRSSLRFYTRERNMADWAITLYEVGVKLHRLGGLTQDLASIGEAADMLRQSLDYYTRARNATDWADTMTAYAGALADYGFVAADGAKLDEAIAAYRSILEVDTRAGAPLRWAGTSVHLAGALYFKAVLANNDAAAREGRDALAEAAAVFDAEGSGDRAAKTRALIADFDALIGQLPP